MANLNPYISFKNEARDAMMERHGEVVSHATMSVYMREIGAVRNPYTGTYELHDYMMTSPELWVEFGETVRASVHRAEIATGGEVIILTDHGVAERVAILIDVMRAESWKDKKEKQADNIIGVIPWRNIVLVFFKQKAQAIAFQSKIVRLLEGESAADILREEGRIGSI